MVKAARFRQFGGPEVLEIVDVPDPHPGPGQVRIAVRAAGVSPGDWKKRRGLMDREFPQTMGHEAAGVVGELGEGVAGVAVGDRVFGFCAEGAAQAELAVLSVWLAGSTTLISWAQSFGTGIHVYNVITASTPVILLCAVVYYLAGHRLGWALRSRTRPAADAPASLTVPEAGN